MTLNILETKVICSNPDNPFHNYFAWPSVARLQDGRLMMVASGLRMKHICPFGKAVGCFSDDEGRPGRSPRSSSTRLWMTATRAYCPSVKTR